uniref:Uncharacterized protein n=1 Tax=Podoviridae sp. ctjUd6 TaxID=2825270 RepID=A0A8S5U2S0_9CAUD|nr:MAG TPA: hypothetical protein [Podoviridae sp. ctjUd6]
MLPGLALPNHLQRQTVQSGLFIYCVGHDGAVK